jgi:hypothetical protein
MPLDKQRLEDKIEAILESCQQENQNANSSKNKFSSLLAAAIIEEVKNLTIVYKSGLIAPSSGGPVTGTIKIDIE